MPAKVLQLYPAPVRKVPLKGLYLAHRVDVIGSPERPFVYGNFISSLDGRIALRNAAGKSFVPQELMSGNDFRLFLELQAQADCLITHGGYMRAIAEGSLDDILQVGTRAETEDLAQWRAAHGLPLQPAVVIASASLDFPIPASIEQHNQPLYIAIGRAADPRRVRALEQQGRQIIFAGEGRQVEGQALTQALGALGYRSMYLLAGPLMLESMLRQRMLSRLYLTITHQILGGEQFHSMIDGPVLGPAGRLQLRSLYYDASSPAEAGQWFGQFAPAD